MDFFDTLLVGIILAALTAAAYFIKTTPKYSRKVLGIGWYLWAIVLFTFDGRSDARISSIDDAVDSLSSIVGINESNVPKELNDSIFISNIAKREFEKIAISKLNERKHQLREEKGNSNRYIYLFGLLITVGWFVSIGMEWKQENERIEKKYSDKPNKGLID